MYTIKYTHTYVCLTCLHVFYSNESIDTRMHMYRHVYICITLHICTPTYIHTNKHTYIHTQAYMLACVYAYTSLYMHVTCVYT